RRHAGHHRRRGDDPPDPRPSVAAQRTDRPAGAEDRIVSGFDDKNMAFNCIDFRREKLADPRRLTEAAEEHLIACPACQAFSRRVNAGERMLQQTVAIDVPDGLAERILVGSRARTRSPFKLWALAASVVFSLGLGVQYWHAAPDRE